MTFQLIRNRDGKLRGLAIMYGKSAIVPRPWRICGVCKDRPAIVFCTSDNDYICDVCIAGHTLPGFCKYLSVSAARDLSLAALRKESESPESQVQLWR